MGMRFFLVCAWLCLVGICGCSEPQITPLHEPLFRLSTTQKPQNCEEKQKLPCVWELSGTLDSFSVVSSQENPFRDCQDCRFNQKFSVVDAKGTRHFLYYRLPTEEAINLQQGTKVELSYTKAENIGRGYAVSLRQAAGHLIFAASSGAGGHYLDKATLSPIEVTIDLESVAGRETSECGTKLYRYLVFRSGGQSMKLAPGHIKIFYDEQRSPYRIANVNHFNREGSSHCKNLSEPPFSFFMLLQPTGT